MTVEWPGFPLDDFSVSLWFRIDGPYEYNSFALFEYGRDQAGPWGAGTALAIDENWHARSCVQGSGYGIVAIMAGDGVDFLDEGCVSYGVMSAWNHLVMTVSGGSATVYFNGVRRDTFSYSAPAPTTNATMWVGNLMNYQSSLTTRIVDDLGIWGRALSPDEIAELYDLNGSDLN